MYHLVEDETFQYHAGLERTMAALEKDTAPDLRLRINRLTIDNYKGIGHLELEFPPPALSGDADVTVIGSENGMGKTSILEAIVLLMCGLEERGLSRYSPEDWAYFNNRFIRSSENRSGVRAVFALSQGEQDASISLFREGIPEISETKNLKRLISACSDIAPLQKADPGSILAPPEDPISAPGTLYFHSYRRIRESDLQKAQESPFKNAKTTAEDRAAMQMPLAEFKNAIAKAILGKAGMLSDPSPSDAQGRLAKLNELLREYAESELTNLELIGRTLEPRVRDLETGIEFLLDGLSSGQKELVSLLFSVWLSSLDSPKIVLIDEPELHLNAQWHRKLVRWLTELAPRNQYILATHSDEVFAAVEQSHRILLKPEGAGTNA
jgi:ABC-type transport system involved in cytochrome c biogenesis ATPase subunit